MVKLSSRSEASAQPERFKQTYLLVNIRPAPDETNLPNLPQL